MPRKEKRKELYQFCKSELESRHQNTKYFNITFFNKFCEYIRLKRLSLQDGTYIPYRESYLKEAIFASNFYQKNSPCYCEFLCIAHSIESELEKIGKEE